MSTISQITTAVTGQTITAAIWNNEFANIYNDYNGGISNANIATNAAIAESKITFSASGHNHNGITSKKILVTDLDPTGLAANGILKVNSGGTGITTGGAGRAFTWGLRDTISVADEQGMKYAVPQSFTVNKIWYKTDSGSLTLRIQRDTTDVISGVNVTSTLGSSTTFSSATLTAGELLTMDVTAISSASGLYVVLECVQT